MKEMIKWVAAQPLAGGMDIGFENAFGNPPSAIITAGFSNDSHYINYMNSIRNLKIPVIDMEADYETFKSKEDEELYNLLCKDVSVLCHVAICSGLSQMNSSSKGSKARGDADNDQNQNMYTLTKLGMRMKAKVIAFENAPQAYTKSGEGTINRLKDIADNFNYSTQLIKTDTLLHGIPQSRKRTFIMFYRDGNPGFFEYENKDYTNLKDYLGEIPSDALHNDQFITNEDVALDHLYDFILDYTKCSTFLDAINILDNVKNTWTSAKLTEMLGFDKGITYIEERIKNSSDADEIAKLTKSLSSVNHYKKKTAVGKSYWDNTTILANRGKYTNAIVGKSLSSMINPIAERGYTIRELLHLMGMPHEYILDNPNKNWNHICQNVPVKTATFIGINILKYLNDELLISEEKFVKQDNIKQQIDEPKITETR